MGKIYLELRMPTNGMRCVEQALAELEESYAPKSTPRSGDDESVASQRTVTIKADHAELKEKYEETKVQLARLLEQAGVGAGDVAVNEEELLQPARDCPSNYVANDSDMYNRVSGQKNENFPTASGMIQISYNDQIGRTFKAKTDLKPGRLNLLIVNFIENQYSYFLNFAGEILMLEKPFVHFLLPEHMMSYCLNCFDPCDLPIPCKDCCLVQNHSD